jgi:hypothetical protein
VFANAAAVFIEAHVTYVVQAIFDAPMAAVERQQARGACFFRCQAGEAIDDLGAELAGDQVRGLALNDEDLSDVGEIQIAVQFGAGPDTPYLEAPVSFIDGFVLRGERLPDASRPTGSIRAKFYGSVLCA